MIEKVSDTVARDSGGWTVRLDDGFTATLVEADGTAYAVEVDAGPEGCVVYCGSTARRNARGGLDAVKSAVDADVTERVRQALECLGLKPDLV